MYIIISIIFYMIIITDNLSLFFKVTPTDTSGVAFCKCQCRALSGTLPGTDAGAHLPIIFLIGHVNI